MQTADKTSTRSATHSEVQGLRERNFWKLIFVWTGFWRHASTESHVQIAKLNFEKSFRLCIDSDKLHNFSISFKPLKRATKITINHLHQECVVTCSLTKTQTLSLYSFIPPSGTVHPKVPSGATKLLNACNSRQHQKSSKTTISDWSSHLLHTNRVLQIQRLGEILLIAVYVYA